MSKVVSLFIVTVKYQGRVTHKFQVAATDNTEAQKTVYDLLNSNPGTYGHKIAKFGEIFVRKMIKDDLPVSVVVS